MGWPSTPLSEYLTGRPSTAATVDLSFADVDVLVGGLPPSTRNLRDWWANNSHTQVLAWREAGWHVESVNLTRQRVRVARGRVGGSRADARSR